MAPHTPKAANAISTTPAIIRKVGRAAQLRLVMYRYLLETYWSGERETNS